MPLFRVTATRVEFYTIEAFVRAATAGEAEELFLELEDGAVTVFGKTASVPRLTRDLDGSELEILDVTDVTASHDPYPSAGPHPSCLLCGAPVRWMGTPAAESPTGKLIPGPWIHVRNPYAEAGIGL